MSHGEEKTPEPEEPVLIGYMAEFHTPGALVKASERIRDAGYTKWDTHTPFPVHGIDEAMGIRPTTLPWVIFGMGLFGLFGGMLLQWWTNAYDYPIMISGKPRWSLPANIPVIFECTVLCAAYTAFFGVHLFNNLPMWYSPLFTVPRFRRVTNDRFFLVVSHADPHFDKTKTETLLKDTHPAHLESLLEADRGHLPKWVPNVGIVATSLALIPLTVALHARYTKSESTRIHIIKDMDSQPKLKAQRMTTFFEDGRADRLPAAHTVAFGELRDDQELLYTGKLDGKFADKFPAPVTKEMMDRGEERFRIYCALCHGQAGLGGVTGLVALHAERIEDKKGWVPPANLTLDVIKAKPLGELFNTITFGKNNAKPGEPEMLTMPAYGAQIPAEDRWAIVLYVRALQKSQNAKPEDVPAGVELK